MKFSQIILLLITINLLSIVVTFSINNNSIDILDSKLEGWFSDSTNGFFTRVELFGESVMHSDNWLLKKIGDIAQGFTSAVNLVLIGFQIVGLVIWALMTPLSYLFFVSEEITILKLMGMISLMFLEWFNIMAIVKLYKFIKGSDG